MKRKEIKAGFITQRYCDMMLRKEAAKSVLYQLGAIAEPDTERYGNALQLPPHRGGHWLWLFPNKWVRLTIGMLADQARRSIDAIIADQLARNTVVEEGVNLFFYKRCLTVQDIKAAADALKTETWFEDSSGRYLILATSEGRLEHLKSCKGFEHEFEYADYIGRELYRGADQNGEYGRLQIATNEYVVFLTVSDDVAMGSVMLPQNAFTVSPIDSLQANFYKQEETKEWPETVIVEWAMQFGARADGQGALVILEATRKVKKNGKR